MARDQSSSRMSANALLTRLNKKHGDGTVVRASEARIKPPRLSTGSLAIDVAMGGGWPVNQWSEVIGNEAAGKTTVVLKTVAAAQARDKNYTVAWVAAESYDEDFAEMLGVDNSRVWLIEENVMEIAYEAVLEYLHNRAVDMVVIDSLPALVPADEDEKSMEEWSPGSGARRTNQFMRKATKATKRSLIGEDRPIVGIIINQWREKIGVLHGDPRTTPGGKAKNFWMYARIEVRRDEWLTDPDTKERVGQAIKVSTFKMKGAPNRGVPAVIDMYYQDCGDIEAGIYDVYKETLLLALLYEVAERKGNAYVYDGVRYPGGKAGFYDALRADSDLFDRVRKEVLDCARSGPDDTPAPPPVPVVASKPTRLVRR